MVLMARSLEGLNSTSGKNINIYSDNFLDSLGAIVMEGEIEKVAVW